MAFAALPSACGVEAAAGGDDAFESGGWEARAAACLVGRHGCSPVCAAAVQVLRPAAGLLRGLGAAVAAAGFDPQDLFARTQTDEVKQGLVANTDNAVGRGAFGIPTLFVGPKGGETEMFFGKERLDQIEEELAKG